MSRPRPLQSAAAPVLAHAPGRGRCDAVLGTPGVESALLLLALGLGACSARVSVGPAGAREPTPTEAPAPVAHPPAAKRAPVPDDVVEQARAPFVGIRSKDPELLASDALLDELSHADLVCVGEEHANAQSHYAEWVVIEGLAERAAMAGRDVGVGLEMLSRPQQPVLDAYLRGDLDNGEFEKESAWEEHWGWDFAYYRPQLELAKRRGLPLLALNAPRAWTRAVARHGIEGLPPELAKRLPELDLDDADHRAWFEQTMKDHPHGNPRNVYAAQVVWDETMAESSMRWLGMKLPGRQLVVLAGSGHCRNDAIPARARRRGQVKVASVRALSGDASAQRAELGAFDYALVFEK